MVEDKYKNKGDYKLVQETLDGDNSAFSELLSRYKNLVYSVILRMVNDKEDANDLAQEVFIKIFRNLDKYHPEYKFSTWAIRISTNHVIDYRRKKKYETVNIDDYVHLSQNANTPEEEYVKKENNNSVAVALNSLPKLYKIPIILYHQQELSYQEISDILEIPLSKVKNRMFRGRKMLKEALINQGEGDKYEV